MMKCSVLLMARLFNIQFLVLDWTKLYSMTEIELKAKTKKIVIKELKIKNQ